MNVLILGLAVVSLIGVMGLVDNAEAESYQEVDLGLIISTCDTSTIEFTSRYIHFVNITQIETSYNFFRNHFEHSEHEGVKVVGDYDLARGDKKDIIHFHGVIIPDYMSIGGFGDNNGYPLCGNVGDYIDGKYTTDMMRLKPITWNFPDESNQLKTTKLTKQEIINLISRTFNLTPNNQPDRTESVSNEQIQKLKDKNKELKNKHGACNDDKDRITDELSELQRLYQIMNTTSNEQQLTIEKLTQELNDAKKKIEDLETENLELRDNTG